MSSETDRPIYTVDTGLPVARELAEMILIKKDLVGSLASLKLWSKLNVIDREDSEENSTICHSLFRDGITQFVSCFDSKNFSALDETTIYSNWNGIAEVFRVLRGLRNSYTAHRHGSARQCVVAASVDPVTGKHIGYMQLSTIYKGFDPKDHEGIFRVIERAIAYTDLQIAVLGERFNDEVSRIKPEDLLKLPAAGIQIQKPTAIGKSRGDIRKAMAVKRRAIGTPYGRRKGTPFPGCRAAMRVALSSRSASPRGAPRTVQLRPEGGLGGG